MSFLDTTGYSPARDMVPGLRRYAMSWASDSTNGVIAGSLSGTRASSAGSPLWSVARTGVGLYRITIAGGFVDLEDLQITCQFTNAADLVGSVVSFDPATGVINLRFCAGAVATDFPTNAANANRCRVTATLRGSTVRA